MSEDPTAKMFHVLLLIVAAWIACGFVVNLPLAPITFRRVLYPLVLESCLVAALILIRCGQFRGAILVYLVGTWVWTTLCVSATEGIRSPVLILYATLPISAAWLLGYKPALWTAGGCTVSMAVFLCLEMLGMTPPRTAPGTPLGIWILAVQATLIGTIPVCQVIKRLLGTLVELQRYKQDLELLVDQRTAELVQARDQAESANAHLEERVAERTAELRESEERFRNMADTAPVLIWVAGPDKLRTFFNKAWLSFAGRSMEQELGNGWADRIHPEDLDRWSATYSSSFGSRSPFRIEYRMRRADGEYRSLLSAGVPRFQSDGAFAGFIGSSLDITELKQAQQRTLAGQKLESLGLLATSIAHDFNNLLGAILSSAELALMERAEGSSWDEELQRIQAAAVGGAQIVSELMIFGAKESPAVEPVDCSLLVREMSQVLKVSLSKSVTLRIELAKDLGMLRGNPAQIRQLIMNLVMNASQAIGDRKGEIRITAGMLPQNQGRPVAAASLPEGSYLQLEIADSGNGMTEEVKARIFDPFFTTKPAGRGLGLAVVQGVVRAHGGVINVVSTPGCGTTFQVWLPCLPMEEISQEENGSCPEVEFKVGTVLVIEDEEALLASVSKMLRRKGVSVIEAGNGSTGVDLFRQNTAPIDAVLLDMTLPGKPGPEVLAELQQIRPGVKVIVTSAYGQEHVQNSLGGLQAWGYIQKPYRLADLEKLLQKSAAETIRTANSKPAAALTHRNSS